MIDCLEKRQQQSVMIDPTDSQQSQQPNMATLISQQQQALMAMYPQQQPRGQQLLLDIASTSTSQANNELIGYYFGSISRETAEWILKNHGNQMDGAYLLRSSGPNDDFVLSLMVSHQVQNHSLGLSGNLEVLHYKIVETEDSFVALHGQVGDEKFATIDELIEKAQGVATKPRWPINRLSLDSQILPPTYWGLTVDQVRLAILIKAKQWGFPMLSSLFNQSALQQHQPSLQDQNFVNSEAAAVNNLASITTLNNETIRTLIYKSLHEFQPWFHGKISREEAERRIEEGPPRDGRFLVRERDNYSYAMCISHKKTTKHYRIDVLPTGELAIQDGRKFTSLMALISHYTIMSDGLWCALTEACIRPVQVTNGLSRATAISSMASQNGPLGQTHQQFSMQKAAINSHLMKQNLYCIPPTMSNPPIQMALGNATTKLDSLQANQDSNGKYNSNSNPSNSLICAHHGGVNAIKAPIKELLQNINHKWTQLMNSKSHHQSLNSFLFGSQNPLNNHCRHGHRHGHQHRRRCKNGHTSCACLSQQLSANTKAPVSNSHPNFYNGQQLAKHHSQTIDKCQDLGNPTRSSNCCSNYPNVCPAVINEPAANNLMPQQNFAFAGSDQGASNLSSLLSFLPQNSGFTLSSQSFIGSPLFAVKKQTSLQGDNLIRFKSQGLSGPTDVVVQEEKLISPAQSISANLNSPYNNDIYGSQTSTVLINDHNRQIPTTSSSSSSSKTIQKRQNSISNCKLAQPKYVSNGNDNNRPAQSAENQIGGQMHSVPIMCGQHAGPAYRYTNFNDKNSFKPCYHRPVANLRASDDLHLVTPSTQLAGPAAMTKFVQFQDGQCLRTHRDTRSIQMAYLNSRQQTAPHGRLHDEQASAQRSQQEMDAQHESRTNQQQFYLPNSHHTFDNLNERNSITSSNNPLQLNSSSGSSGSSNRAPIGQSQAQIWRANQIQNNMNQFMNTKQDQTSNLCDDIDLMYCGNEEDAFEFKYDPKLIKSSSIETLCGAGQETNDGANLDLANCKSNAELIQSLQAYWQPTTTGGGAYDSSNILNPLTVSSCETNQVDASYSSAAHNDNLAQFSTLMRNSNDNDGDNYESMKKKHDLDELTTALLAELTASLKAQVDLKNKRAGLGLHSSDKLDETHCQAQPDQSHELNRGPSGQRPIEANPLELVNEFDALFSGGHRNP